VRKRRKMLFSEKGERMASKKKKEFPKSATFKSYFVVFELSNFFAYFELKRFCSMSTFPFAAYS
jgi:hypothetical protein